MALVSLVPLHEININLKKTVLKKHDLEFNSNLVQVAM